MKWPWQKPSVLPPPVNPRQVWNVPQGVSQVRVAMIGGGGGGGAGGAGMSGAQGGAGGGGAGQVMMVGVGAAGQGNYVAPDELICYQCLLDIRDDLAHGGEVSQETMVKMEKILEGDWT